MDGNPWMSARPPKPDPMPLSIPPRHHERQRTPYRYTGMGMFEDPVNSNPWVSSKTLNLSVPTAPPLRPLPVPPHKHEQIRKFANPAESIQPEVVTSANNYHPDSERQKPRASARPRVRRKNVGRSVISARQTTKPSKGKERTRQNEGYEPTAIEREVKEAQSMWWDIASQKVSDQATAQEASGQALNPAKQAANVGSTRRVQRTSHFQGHNFVHLIQEFDGGETPHGEEAWWDKTPDMKELNNDLTAQEAADMAFAQSLAEEEIAAHLAAAALAASGPQARDCTVCGDSLQPLSFPAKPPTSSCKHSVGLCTSCLEEWTASQLDDGGWQDIRCPECPSLLSYAEMHIASSTATFTRYDDLCIRGTLGDMSNFSWCLAPNCGFGQENLDNEHGSFMKCMTCRYRQCLKHRVAWHDGETCEAYEYRTSGRKKRDEEEADQAWLKKEASQCPGKKCGAWIQKKDGVSFSTCSPFVSRQPLLLFPSLLPPSHISFPSF